MTEPAAVLPNDAERLARLHALDVLDNRGGPIFDALTRIAAAISDSLEKSGSRN